MITAGTVLTGGASRRMGANKATLLVDGQPLAVRVANVLADAGCAPIWFQGGDADELSALAATAQVVPDPTPGRGPVSAIASALEFAATSAGEIDGVLVAACDLIDLDVATVQSVIHAGGKGRVAAAREGDRGWHLLSWWSVALVDPVATALANGVNSYQQLLRVLDQPGVHDGHEIESDRFSRVDSVQVSPGALRNVNTLADLQR